MKRLMKSLFVATLLVLASCGKEFLDIRREANQVVPQTIADYQAILDWSSVMNAVPSVELGIIGSDEYYLLDGRLATLSSPYQRNGYIWADDVYEHEEVRDWNFAYQRILYANLALDVDKLVPADDEREMWENTKGIALFHRAYNLYQLAQLFCKPYDGRTAIDDHGVPLPLDYDVTQPVNRGAVADVYHRILSDLGQAIELLPETAANKLRPNKAAACVLMARVQLQMDNYEKAEYYADMGISSYGELLDHNMLDTTLGYTFPVDNGESNPEVLFFWRASMTITLPARFNVDTALLAQYEPQDLRTKTFFSQTPDDRTIFKGSYSGISGYFVGLATAELWLMRAECRARLGNTQGALDDINHLLRHRYRNGEFIPITASSNETALAKILLERRKELFMRGTRWEDLRRLNKESHTATVLARSIDGVLHELPPQDPRWVWPIPENEIALSGLVQNER